MQPAAPDRAQGLLPEATALFVILVWGSTFTITKSLYAEMLPLAFGSLRFMAIVGIAMLVLWFQARRANRPDWLRIRRADLPMFVITGLFGYTGYQLGFLLGLEHTSPFAASLFISLQPLVTLLLVTIIGERQPALVWIGALISLVGVAIFLLSSQGESHWLGNIIAFLGGASFAVYQVFNRRLVREYSAATYSAWSTLFGSLPLMLMGIPSLIRQDWGSVSLPSWLAFAYMCVLPVYVAYMLWAWSIRHRGVAIAGYLLLVPVIAGVLSWMFYGESFDARKIIGGAIAVAGLILMQVTNARARKRAPDPAEG